MERLHARYAVKRVSSVGFVTLTCNPRILGADLQEQFERVKAERLVSRFVRLFSKVVRRRVQYISVMEFHKKSRQVHFHIALDDCGRLHKRAIRLLQAWCQKNMGTFDYKYMPSYRALRYCVKYLTKGARESLPDWCADYGKPIRPFTASRGFWHDGKKRNPTKSKKGPRVQRTLRERFVGCEQAGVIGVEENVAEDGEIKRRFAFVWPHPFDLVRQIASGFVESVSGTAIAEARSSFSITMAQVSELSRRVCGPPQARPAQRAAWAGP